MRYQSNWQCESCAHTIYHRGVGVGLTEADGAGARDAIGVADGVDVGDGVGVERVGS